jgi:hypothetical protein
MAKPPLQSGDLKIAIKALIVCRQINQKSADTILISCILFFWIQAGKPGLAHPELSPAQQFAGWPNEFLAAQVA